jgi:hypothetical protein
MDTHVYETNCSFHVDLFSAELKNNGAIPLLLLYAFVASTGTTSLALQSVKMRL